MNDSIYEIIENRISTFQEILNEYTNGKGNKMVFLCEKYGKNIAYPPRYTIEFDQLKKDFPDVYKHYLNIFLVQYETLEYLFAKADISNTKVKILDIKALFICIDDIIKHLNRLLSPENEIQDQPQKFEKLKPIEKILIIHYLKIESLKRYQYHLKPGVFFLSRLLDINPESIKNPVLKLSDYTTTNIDSEYKARNLYPTLEKVKSFFENSDLNEISKVIEIRINELKVISGKD